MQVTKSASDGFSVDQVQEIRAQLSRIVESRLFSGSKRFGPLLTCIVDQALGDGACAIKERTIGIEVFGRSPDYDTSTDPIVRVGMAEVRRRLEQYYFQKGHAHELRIELLPGSYQPKFVFPEPHAAEPHAEALAFRIPELNAVGADPLESPSLPSPSLPSPSLNESSLNNVVAAERLRPYQNIPFLLCALALVAVLLTPMIPRIESRMTNRSGSIDEFWAPVLAHQKEIILVIGGHNDHSPTGNPNTAQPVPTHLSPDASLCDHMDQMLTVNLADASALARISQFTGGKVANLRLLSDTATELADLRERPAVLIGGLNDFWALKFTRPLRYHFVKDPSIKHTYYVADSMNPNNKTWSLNFFTPFSKVTNDYAVIARINNPETGQPEIIASGLGATGTLAAAEFLVNPDAIEEAREQMHLSSLAKANFELVLQVESVGDTPATPHIVASSVF